MLFYLVAIFIVLLDQFTKFVVVSNMELYESIPIIDGWLHITSVRNTGAAFSILENQTLIFIVLALVVALVLIYSIYRVYREYRLLAFFLSIILGGAVGNLIDRILHGAVIDFIDMRIINFAIFNVADIAITVGTGLLILYILFSKKNKFLN